MKVIIDIPENDYKLACNHPDALIACYAHYIKAGVPLPKKHGRLIDVDKVKEDHSDFEYLYVIDDAPIIIEAEEGENK